MSAKFRISDNPIDHCMAPRDGVCACAVRLGERFFWEMASQACPEIEHSQDAEREPTKWERAAEAAGWEPFRDKYNVLCWRNTGDDGMTWAATAQQLCEAHDIEPEDTERKPAFYTVAIFLVDKAYGGPEEGGWWYCHGTRVDGDLSKAEPLLARWAVPAIFRDEDTALAFMMDAQRVLDETLNKRRRSDIGSVLSEGRYAAEIHEGYPPEHWPATTPHYE